jgi:hypothetical protein
MDVTEERANLCIISTMNMKTFLILILKCVSGTLKA